MKELLAKEKQKTAILKKYGYDIVRARDFILKKAKLGHGPILEIGTGKGHFALALAQKGFSLTSVDLDLVPQRLAREYLRQKRLDKKVRILVMDAEKLKFPDESFNAVVSVNFMHHAKNPVRCLNEMVRVAMTKIVIADVNAKGADILRRVHKREGHDHPPSRISFLAMRQFLERKGFSVKTYKGFCQTILIAQERSSK